MRGIGARFCHLLQVPIPGEQKPFHVAREDNLLDHPSEEAQRGSEGKVIDHERPGRPRDELVDMPQLPKSAPRHLVREPIWALIGGDLRGESLSDAEVYGLPGHGVPQAHHASRHPRDRVFVCVGDGVMVQVHAEREVETLFDRGIDVRLEVNDRHASFSHMAPMPLPSV
jgi:hypothetical protein